VSDVNRTGNNSPERFGDVDMIAHSFELERVDRSAQLDESTCSLLCTYLLTLGRQ
jgi:hypothetical protein